MQVSQKLAAVKIHRRVGLAIMAFATVLPVGLSAVGSAQSVDTFVIAGFPLVLLGAIAWRGRGAGQKRILRQKQFVIIAATGLLGSVLVSDWPRAVAIRGTVALNINYLHRAADDARAEAMEQYGWTAFGLVPKKRPDMGSLCALTSARMVVGGVSHGYQIGLTRSCFARVNNLGDVIIYANETDRTGQKHERCIYFELGPGR